jgi:lipopolysaccharide/colanic/teichoic acid biosynthesis glycosyltransferase
VAKANLRLKRPSSHTRLLSRVIVLDVLWGGLSPLAAFLLRDGTIQRPASVITYCGIAFLVSLLVFQWFQTSSPIARFYSIRDAFELIKACVLIAALSAAASFVLTRLEEAPRSIPILHFMFLASGLLGARILLRLRDTRRQARTPIAPGQSVEHVVIIEASRLAWFFSKMVEELAPGRYQIVALLDERPILKHRSLNGYPIIGAPSELEKVIADYAAHGVRIDKVVLAAQPDEISEASWNEVTRVCYALHIGLDILPERLMSHEPADGQDAAVIANPAPTPTAAEDDLYVSLDRTFWKFKRAISLVVTLTLALLLSPIILVVCALAMLDVGFPVVFWQQRVGRNGTPLYLYKFRTLQTLFDRRTKEKREAQSPSLIGRFLRSTRLDELPQLWNILSGDMSIVGPRPLLPIDQPTESTFRLAVRPGLTGWAQVCGGTLISVEEKNALDEWYIRHASLKLDIAIVLRTIWMLLVGQRRNEGAIATALGERLLFERADEVAAMEPAIKNAPDEVRNQAEAISS